MAARTAVLAGTLAIIALLIGLTIAAAVEGGINALGVVVAAGAGAARIRRVRRAVVAPAG